eukprot:6214742-Pleurochrysis_carterae.AAC.3
MQHRTQQQQHDSKIDVLPVTLKNYSTAANRFALAHGLNDCCLRKRDTARRRLYLLIGMRGEVADAASSEQRRPALGYLSKIRSCGQFLIMLSTGSELARGSD